ncbi:class I SAM-dependent methyltransferase [Amaricoccus macauensis]|uniref:class I SAM-dependent methyltransferase n=1 Tax=Amaricoccus macauensis TaxID=57001 RepID=UPI003C7CAC83
MSEALERLIRNRISEIGPISVAEYMSWCLAHPEHGYYMAPGRIGAAGDFTTAPEISQMFGEMIGLWLAQVWHDHGRPAPFVLAELGPGRGTLMRDILRAATALPGFLEAAEIWLVETSTGLRDVQRETLAGHAVHWAERVEVLPDAPLFLVANEFFDALPIRQYSRTGDFWAERKVRLEADKSLGFQWARPVANPDLDRSFVAAPDGVIVEVNPLGEHVAGWIGKRIAERGGAALFIDYGAWDGTGDTLQALRQHASYDPLDAPGEADVTAHVRFRALAEAARPARAVGTVPQGVFLERLGITARAQVLARGLKGEALTNHVAAHRRLTHPEEMGNLFQVLALTGEGAPPLPGFDE